VEITTSYSLIWLWACVTFSGLLTLLAYYRNPSVKNLSLPATGVAAFLRFAVLFLLSFLLLKPLVESYIEEKERPTLIFAQDDSESIKSGFASVAEEQAYQASLTNLLNSLSSDYDVVTMSFGDVVTDSLATSYQQKYTDYSQLQQVLDNRYAQTNVGAVIVASDGLINRGINPLYQSTSLSAPVYSILLGDTTAQRDVRIGGVQHNAIVFQGNAFPIRVDVRADGVKNESLAVSIWSKGKLIQTKNVQAKSQQFVDFQLESDELGVQAYEARVSVVANEKVTANNRSPFFIDVLQNKYRVLILTEAPHPDVKAVRRALESKQDYEVTVAYTNDIPNDLTPYQLVIAFTGTGKQASLLQSRCQLATIPICWVVQPDVNRAVWNQLNTGVTLDQTNQRNLVTGVTEANFSLYQLSDELSGTINSWPPVITPFGKYQQLPGIESVITQQVGQVKTNAPLVAVRQVQDEKTGFVFADGLWRWRMADYKVNRNFDAFNELITKWIRFVLVRTDKSRFRISYPKLVAENTAIVVQAEVYDASLELTTKGDVAVTLTDSIGNELNYELLPQGNGYGLNMGTLPVGNYSLTANAKIGQETFTKSGSITVSPITIELAKSQADHQLLTQWATQRNGASFYPNQLEELAATLNTRTDIHTIVHQRKTFSSWLEQWWPLLLALALLTAEWFTRKYAGSY